MRFSIDFDNTIAKTKYPEIIRFKRGAKWALQKLYRHHTIIINTCRAGKASEMAENFLKENNVPYDYFNENDHALIDFYETDTRKISADKYIDDKNFFGIYNLVLVWLIIWLKTLRLKSVKKPLVFAIVGESGTGKTMLSEYIKNTYNIQMIESYTDRPKRHPDEKGHTFLTPDEFNKLPIDDMMAITRFGGHRYCCLKSDLDDVNTYVIDETGLDMLMRFAGVKWDVVAVRLLRDKDERIAEVGEERVKRDEGRFTRKLEEYNEVFPMSYASNINNLYKFGDELVENYV